MKLVIDENLPARLQHWLASRGCEAVHVKNLNLKSASDQQIWSEALKRGAGILSRDDDFVAIARAETSGFAIKLTIGNCTTQELLDWLDRHWPSIAGRVASGERVIEV